MPLWPQAHLPVPRRTYQNSPSSACTLNLSPILTDSYTVHEPSRRKSWGGNGG
ncbi:hypothetical protein BJY04DRAFT_146494 [Aspergillus karnatakaensis]|uniref:uncharacterized protein n=1 Tax=Aspergillus karnatakaensis TaxID=1810916 RepID=UPI003CCCF9A4